MNKALETLLPRVVDWPEEDQLALLSVAAEIEAARQGHRATAREDLAAIDQGLADMRAGRFASAAQVEAVRAKFRTA